MPDLAGGRALFLHVSSSFVRDCVMLRKTRWWRIPEDGISSPSPCPGDAYSIAREVCLCRIYLCLICWDLFVVPLHSCLFRLDPSDLRYSSSAAVAVLLRWFYGVLARRLPDCLLQQVLHGSGEGGAMTAMCLRLASMVVVIARWSTDLNVIFII